uniref:Uncharacterized protein n=1 Tax=Arundo donax TaxID=35708 RepID=A0A0A9BGZ5_ARUDO
MMLRRRMSNVNSVSLCFHYFFNRVKFSS